MFGFNKQDVLSYIESLINKSEEERASFAEQIEALDTQLQDKSKLYEALLENNRELESRMSKDVTAPTPAEVSELKDKLSASENERIALLENVRYLESELSSEKKKNAELSSELHLALEELKEYRRQKQNIGSVLMRAQNEADIMVSDAQDKRAHIIKRTDDYLDDVRRMYEKYATQITAEQTQVKASAQSIVSEFDNILNYIYQARSMLDDMSKLLTPPNSTTEG